MGGVPLSQQHAGEPGTSGGHGSTDWLLFQVKSKTQKTALYHLNYNYIHLQYIIKDFELYMNNSVSLYLSTVDI